LRSLFKANQIGNIEMSVFITDDGCTDGTSEAISQEFSDRDIRVFRGDGNLFWAGGMRNSWREALKFNYDGYLLLNDDTYVFDFLFYELSLMHHYSLAYYNKSGIYCGITCNSAMAEMTYGGSIIINEFLYKSKRLSPNGKYQRCDLGNANIMLVPSEVITKIGIFDEKYTHAIADYDYTLRAKKERIPVLLSSKYCGICDRNPPNNFCEFGKMNLASRVKYMYSPKGFDFSNQLYYMKKNFTVRFPIYFIVGWIKILLPKIYLSLDYRK
jgi:GT2 family glycosyltransferase